MNKDNMLGKYNLIRHIATGGMAEIWLAEQEGPGGFHKQLVIKKILPHLARDEHFSQMFMDEARMVAHLTHPNIGQVFELGEIEGEYFIAMEYIEGLDLDMISDKAKVQGALMPIPIAMRIMTDVLQALEYAHNFVDREGMHVGLVHRDVTPHNVLVSNDGVVKLVDFGVAKARANQSKTQTGAVKGKFAYMAPEQIEQSAPDRRVDIFAAGVVLYEVLTGHKPFGDDLFAVNAILNVETPDPRKHRDDLPQSIVNILNVALEKDREKRYQSAASMARDLEEFLRLSGHYVSTQDVGAYMHLIQGIESRSSVQPSLEDGPRAMITIREELEAPEAFAAPLVTDVLETAANTSISEAAAAAAAKQMTVETTQSFVVAPSEARHNKGLIGIFVFILCAILAAGVSAIYLVLQPGVEPREVGGSELTSNKTEVKTEVKTKAIVKDVERADPTALRHADGGLVFIDASAPSKLYFSGKFLGETPFRTTLRPGVYKLMVVRGDKKKKWKIRVDMKMGLQNFKTVAP